MGRKFYKPSEEDLSRAFTLKNQGICDADVAEALGIAHSTYNNHKKEFLKYFARKTRDMHKKGVGKPRGSTMLKSVERQIISLAGLGLTIPKVAELIGMSDRTLYHWLDVDEVLKHKVETAKEQLDSKIVKSLYNSGVGNARELSTSVVETYDRRGNLVNTIRTTLTKRIRPSISATRLWLLNRKDWKLQSEGGVNADVDKVEYDVRERLYNSEEEDK